MEKSDSQSSRSTKTKGVMTIRPSWQTLRRLSKYLGLFSLGLIGIIGVGSFIPRKISFESQKDCSVTIFVSNFSHFHTELILPVQNAVYDWRSHFSSTPGFSDVGQYQYLMFGWGDHDFYRTGSMDPKTTSKALFWPSNTVLHVWGRKFHPRQLPKSYTVRGVAISQTEYRRLVAYLQSSFQTNPAGQLEAIGPGLAQSSHFFHANGPYSAINTCNHWTANALNAADINTPIIPLLPAAIINLVKSDCPEVSLAAN